MTSSIRNRSLAVLAIGTFGFGLSGCNKPDLHQDKARYSYAIGVQIGRNLKTQNIDLDAKAFAAGVEDIYDGKTPQLSDAERMSALKQMSDGLRAKDAATADANKKKGDAFLEENKSKPGWKVTKDGLQYHMVREGSGKAPTKDDTVQVNYEGKLIDGTVFDSSYKRGQPAEFPVGGVIPGWTEALQLMKPGSEYELAIPPELAYGPTGNPSIPPNSVLLFKVELLKVLPHAGESAPHASGHAKGHGAHAKKPHHH